MSLTIHDDVEQRSPEWFALRCGIITASTVGKLLTPTLKVADNDTSRGIMATLVAERITGETEQSFISDDMQRGIDLEPVARDAYSRKHAQAVEVGFAVRTEEDWTLGFSPDGLVGDDGLIEIKAPRPKGHILTVLSGTVPAQHMAQCQAGLLVTGRKWLDFISYCAGLHMWVTRVLPDPAWQEAIVAACKKYEATAADMVAAYAKETNGLPRIPRYDPYNVELKLA